MVVEGWMWERWPARSSPNASRTRGRSQRYTPVIPTDGAKVELGLGGASNVWQEPATSAKPEDDDMDPMQALATARRALTDMRVAQQEANIEGQLRAGHDLADAFEYLNNWLGATTDIRSEDELAGVIVSYAESCDDDTVRASLAGIPAGHIVTATLRDGTTIDAETVGFITNDLGETVFAYRPWDEDDGAGADVLSLSVGDLVEIRVF